MRNILLIIAIATAILVSFSSCTPQKEVDDAYLNKEREEVRVMRASLEILKERDSITAAINVENNDPNKTIRLSSN